MNFAWVLWIVLYLMTGWIISDSTCRDKDNETKIVVFITWPLIFIVMLLMTVLLVAIGIVYFLIKGFYKLWESLNGK